MPDRLDPYRKIAKELGVDAIAVVPGSNFTRVFGHAFHSNERPLVAIIPQDGAPAAIVPNLEMASFAAIGFEGEIFDWRDETGYDLAFAAMAAHLPLKSLAVEGQIMRVFVHQALVNTNSNLKIIDGEAQIAAPRLVKTDAEIAALTDAISISERALVTTLEQVRVGQSEKHIERILVQNLLGQGADGLAFGPIVAAGTNSARPHAHAREDYAIKPGDALLFDFGARTRGLCADITRTVFVGEPDDYSRQVYDTVKRANERGHAITRPGLTAHDIDDAVMSELEASPFADLICHKTGHGLGRDVHEAPYIMRGNHQKMLAGMVFTNEPGLYDLDKLGVRIEDDILVTETGCRSLTTFPKELLIVG